MIEQRLLMLRNMEQQNILEQTQQNVMNYNPQQQVQQNVDQNITVNTHDPLTTELAFHAMSNANQTAQNAHSQCCTHKALLTT